MIKNNPQLLFVAGPNGAGKSTFSKDFSEPDAVIFDVDKVIARIEAQTPGLSKKQVYEQSTQEFFDLAETAVKFKRHFTLETNFRDEGLMDIVDQFEKHGYTTNLFYLTLEHMEQSVFRVNERVTDGGHFVDHKNIQQNYDLGLAFLERFADRFDNLEMIDASRPNFQLRSLLRIQNGIIQHVYDLVPGKVAQTVRAIVQQFTPPAHRGPH